VSRRTSNVPTADAFQADGDATMTTTVGMVLTRSTVPVEIAPKVNSVV
jgi:hypothetical protein